MAGTLLSLWRVVLLELIFGNKMKRLIIITSASLLLTMSLSAQNNFSTKGWWEPAGKTYPLVENGSITFRLDAPEARKVTLLFDEWTMLRQEMSRGQDGIWETTVSGVKPGCGRQCRP